MTLLFFLVTAPATTYAQQISNIHLEQVGEKIVIHYDLVSASSSVPYQIKVYQSADSFQKPISFVKGDIGDKVTPGTNKKIDWYAREELGNYKGSIIIEIRVFESPNNIYIHNPQNKQKIKRGKIVNLRWTGGISETKVNIQLVEAGRLVKTIANRVDNSGQYTWTISKDLKPGKNYAIQILGTSNDGVQSTGPEFVIKRQVPIWAMVAPVVVVGAALGIIMSNDSSSGNNNLPAAPDPN